MEKSKNTNLEITPWIFAEIFEECVGAVESAGEIDIKRVVGQHLADGAFAGVDAIGYLLPVLDNLFDVLIRSGIIKQFTQRALAGRQRIKHELTPLLFLH